MSLPPVVFLSSIDWSDSWQRHQIFASAFAKRGHEVYFVENTGFRDVRLSDAARVLRRLRRVAAPAQPARKRVRVIPPLVLPPTNRLFRWLNDRILLPRLARQLRAAGLSDAPVVFAYTPTATTLSLIDILRPRGVVYDCASNFRQHPQASADTRELEQELLRRSASVVTDSDYLHAQKEREHPRVHQIHQGVPKEFFVSPDAPAAYRTACYFGTIHDGLDYAAIRALAESGIDVTLLGAVKHAPPPLPGRVKIAPALEAEELPAALARFDMLLLPYRLTEFNKAVVPAKIYECLATGKPVLTCALPSLSRLSDALYVARETADWPRLAAGLAASENEDLRRLRRSHAKRHLREDEIERLLALLGPSLAAPPVPLPPSPSWSERARTLLGTAAAAAVTAFLIRAAVAWWDADQTLFPPHYYNDARRFHLSGMQVLAGMRGDGPWPELDISRRGFQTLIGLIYFVSGHEKFPAQLLVCVFGGLSVWFLARLGERLVSRRAGLIAAWTLALWPSSIFYGAQLIKDGAIMPWILASLLGTLGTGPAARSGLLSAGIAGLIRPHVGILLAGIWAAKRFRDILRPSVVATLIALEIVALYGTSSLIERGAQVIPQEFASLRAFPAALTEFRTVRQRRENRDGRRVVESHLFKEQRFRHWGDVILFVPKAGFYAAFMPLPGLFPLQGKLSRILSAMENVLWLVITALAALALKRRGLRPDDRVILCYIGLSCVIWGIFDLDLGAASRHKLQYMPLLLIYAASLLPKAPPRREVAFSQETAAVPLPESETTGTSRT